MYYAYYDPETMKVTGLSNSLDESRYYIKIDEATYVDFVSGKKNMRHYCVVSTATTKKLIPKKVDDSNFNIEKSVHEFKKIKEYRDFKFKDNIFYIIQDKIDNNWKAKVVLNGIQDNLSHLFINTKDLYITEVNNPNILLQTIHIDMSKFLLGEEFVIFDTEVNADVSLFAHVRDEEFIHLVREYES